MQLSPDELVYWQYGFFKLNATIVFTWVLMLILAVGSKIITRNLSTDHTRSRWQNLLEIVVTGIAKQVEEVGLSQPRKYLGFLGTLFLFVAAASLFTIVPGYQPPTGSLSTTTALALCVLVAVPLYGITEQGFGGYLKTYVQPTFIMLPFNLISEVSRTLALAVRLFGNTTLRDLADTSLEERITQAFIHQLREMNENSKQDLAEALTASSEPVRVRSAFGLPEAQKIAIRHALKEISAADTPVHFEVAPNAIGGIELTFSGRKIAWSIDEYLTSLQKSISELTNPDEKTLELKSELEGELVS